MRPVLRWIIAAALLVALVIDAIDGEPVKLFGTAVLAAAAVLFASSLPQRSPAMRLLMLGLLGVAVAVLLYRLLIKHA